LMVMNASDQPAPLAPVVVAALSPSAVNTALTFARDLRERGIAVELEARDARVKAVIRRAEGVGARWLVLIGEDEVVRGEVSLKDLAMHRQEALTVSDAIRNLAEMVKQHVSSAGPSESLGGD